MYLFLNQGFGVRVGQWKNRGVGVGVSPALNRSLLGKQPDEEMEFKVVGRIPLYTVSGKLGHLVGKC